MKLTLSTQNRTFASPAYAVWQTGIIQDLRIFNPVSVLSSSSGWYVNLVLNMITLVLLLGHSGPSPNTLATSQIHPVSLLVGGIPLYPA